MAPRTARATTAPSSKKTSTNKNRKRQQDAFAIAGKILPSKKKTRDHRLGEVEDDEPRSKRRRAEGTEDEDEEEDSRPKRRRQQSEDDYVEHGSDSEGNNWTIGEVADDDDESIDSDMAFGESDEERFQGFTFRGSSSNKKTTKPRVKSTISNDINLNESEDISEEDDDFGDEGVDLATMLDGDQEDGSDDADDESPSEQSDDDMEDEDDNEERHARLQDFVENLDKDRSKPTAPRTDNDHDQLELEDLLEGADIDSRTLSTLRPKKKSAPELVKAALPKRQQDAIDRKLAKQKADETLDKYQDTVKMNRRAETLTFPLVDPDRRAPSSKDTFAPAQETAPTTELEANIRQIMEESGLVSKTDQTADPEDDLLKAEGLAMKTMPIEEVLARRAELSRQRNLLFFEEVRAKRQAKIKSRRYRREHRKDRERLAEKERMLLDPEGFANGELNEDEQELADRRRAEARMNTKHKDSKWAKSLKATNRSAWDADARNGVEEQARRQQELKKRIAGRDDSASEDDSEDDEGGDLTAQLSRLANTEAPEAQGLAAMKFMQTAEKRRKAENDAAILQLQRELGGEPEEEIEDDGLGRAIFGPKPAAAKADKPVVQRADFEEGSDLDDDNVRSDNGDTTVTEVVNNKPSKSRPLSKVNTTAQTGEDTVTSTSAWLTAPKGKKSKLDRKLAREDNGPVINTTISEVPVPAQESNTAQAVEKNVSNTNGWTTVTYEHDEDNEITTEKPILSKAEQNAAFHARAFAGDDVAVQFDAEKDELIASEDEKEVSTHMAGWGSWGGAGLSKMDKKIANRARHNPLYKNKVDGVRPANRKDAKLENVIISEKSDRKGKKYLAPILPHQYERKDEYERSLRMPIGPEWTTKEVFQRNTKPRVLVKPGTIIEPMSKPLI